MFNELIKAKELLISYIEKVSQEEYDSIEYLVDTMDYLMLGKIPCNEEILNIIIEDILVCNSFHRNNNLLKVATILSEIAKGEQTCMK